MNICPSHLSQNCWNYFRVSIFKYFIRVFASLNIKESGKTLPLRWKRRLYIDTKGIRNSSAKETARIAKGEQEAGRVLRQTAGPFIFPSCASVPAGRRFFHGRQLSSPVSSARLLRYQPVVDEVVNGRIERNARIRYAVLMRRANHYGRMRAKVRP